MRKFPEVWREKEIHPIECETRRSAGGWTGGLIYIEAWGRMRLGMFNGGAAADCSNNRKRPLLVQFIPVRRVGAAEAAGTRW